MTVKDNSATLHNVRFYKPSFRAIHNMALQKDIFQLAISRSDSTVEVWNVQHYPFLQHFFPSSPSCSIEDIKWCGKRLFSCGLQGTVVEYDCFKDNLKKSTSVTGGVAWCLDYSPMNNLLAVGTEEGFINVFTVTEEELEYFKMLDKQQGRILCMSWDKTGQFLVTGSLDVVRVWNIASGHAVHKMTTGRSQSKRETVVWSVAVTSDLTIISGDSRGILTFWDGKLGTQIENLRSHDADILSVALTPDDASVVCAGVDPVIAVYGRVVHANSKRQWARGGLYRMHEHDVRAICTSPDGRIFSGGVSGFLTVTGTSPKIRLKCPPFLKGECVQVAGKKKQVLLRYLDRIEVWQLGEAAAVAVADSNHLPLAHKPSCLLRVSAESGKTIISAGMSLDGRYVIYSTQNSLHVFLFNLEDRTLVKLQPPSECGASHILVFYVKDNRQYCVATTVNNKIYELELTENGVEETRTLLPSVGSCVTDRISHVSLSASGRMMALADCSSHIAVWSTDSWALFASLPTYSAVPTALAFPNDTSLIIAYSDHKVSEFNLIDRKYSDFSKSLGKLFGGGVFHNTVTGILFDARRTNSLIIHDDAIIFSLLREKNITNGAGPKKKPKNYTDTISMDVEKISENLLIKKFKHILTARWLDKDELVIVEVTPLALTDSLPPALLKKKFGT